MRAIRHIVRPRRDEFDGIGSENRQVADVLIPYLNRPCVVGIRLRPIAELMSTQRIFRAAVYRKAALIDGCCLPAKVDQAEQMPTPKRTPRSSLPATAIQRPLPSLPAWIAYVSGIYPTDARQLDSRPQPTQGGRQPRVDRNRCCTFAGGLKFPGKPASLVGLLREDSESFDLARGWVLRGDEDAFFEIDLVAGFDP